MADPSRHFWESEQKVIFQIKDDVPRGKVIFQEYKPDSQSKKHNK
jgi:hypothetical protein